MTIAELHKLRDKKNKGKSTASEHDLQVQCVRWFRYTHQDISSLLFAIPNGGQRNNIVAAKLKAEGVVSGVPDLFLAVPKGSLHGLWIEMKNGKAGRLSDNQKTMITELRNQDYAVEVAHDFDEFVKTIEEYLK